MLFNPTRDEVRQFFCEAWRKSREGLPLIGLEPTAVDLMQAHPEYHATLNAAQSSLGKEWRPEDGESNPFLHLSMHLAVEEQLSIDQPAGIRAAFERIVGRVGDRYTAAHEIIECLGTTLWEAQRDQRGPDAAAYLDCIRRRVG
jgi:Domain of unknown function (DUF1841)